MCVAWALRLSFAEALLPKPKMAAAAKTTSPKPVIDKSLDKERSFARSRTVVRRPRMGHPR